MVTEGLDGVHVHHVLEVIEVPGGDLLNLVRGTETVEEVQERHLALDGSQVGDGREVHDLLDVALCQHGEAGLAAGHDVGVVTEDVEGLGGNRTGGHVEDAGELLRGNLVHVRDHEEQALRGGVGGGKRTSAQRAVDGAGSTSLRLHLDDLDGRAEDVLHALSCPLVNMVGHGAGRRDRVDARHLREGVRDPRGGLVTVH